MSRKYLLLTSLLSLCISSTASATDLTAQTTQLSPFETEVLSTIDVDSILSDPTLESSMLLLAKEAPEPKMPQPVRPPSYCTEELVAKAEQAVIDITSEREKAGKKLAEWYEEMGKFIQIKIREYLKSLEGNQDAYDSALKEFVSRFGDITDDKRATKIAEQLLSQYRASTALFAPERWKGIALNDVNFMKLILGNITLGGKETTLKEYLAEISRFFDYCIYTLTARLLDAEKELKSLRECTEQAAQSGESSNTLGTTYGPEAL